jgi:hypothetical protein
VPGTGLKIGSKALRPFLAQTRDRAAPGNSAPCAASPRAPPGSCTPFPEPVSTGTDDRPAARNPAHAQPTGGSSTVRLDTQRDRLRAGKRDKPGPSFRCNHRVASRPCTVVERRQHPQFRCSLQAARHCLLAHSGPARDGVSRWLIQVSKDNPGPLHAARRLAPRAGNID